MEKTANDARPSITIDDVLFEWDRENGLFLCWGAPVVVMWTETVMAGFMSGLQKMVGTERFNLALMAAGRDSADAEWDRILMAQPTVEEGFAFLGEASSTVGLGRWKLVSLDRQKKEARFQLKSSWEGLYQKSLGVSWGTCSMAGKLGRFCTRLFGTHCRAEQTSFSARGDEYDEFVVRPSDVTLEDELERLLAVDKATSLDLTVALRKLKEEIQERSASEQRLQQEIRGRVAAQDEVRERKAAEQRLQQEIDERAATEEELRRNLDVIRRQEEAIRAMSTPILQIWAGVLALPVIGVVDSVRAAQMMESLLQEVSAKHARFAILDLTGVEMMDASAADHLLKLVRALGLLGTRCLVSGISSQMAQTIVELGIDLNELTTFNTLELALRHAIRESA